VTKETKIGLLVGLAFIILFAIILSEKGATNTTMTPSDLTMAEGPSRSQVAPDAEPFNRIGRLNVDSQQPARRGQERPGSSHIVMREEPASRDIPSAEEDILPLPSAVVSRLNLHAMETEVDVDDVESASAKPLTLSEALSAALTKSTVGEGASPAGSEARLPEDRAAMARASDLETTGVEPRPTSQKPSPPMTIKILAAHTVQPGESLSKIAARYYGRATPARITAIFDANRKTLPSIDRVRAGNKLDIPALDDMETIAFEPVSNFPAADVVASRSRPRESVVRIPIPVDDTFAKSTLAANTAREHASPEPAAPTRPDFRWYEVRDKDTLSGIAQRELGNEKKFLDIAKLNRDIIRNKNVIKPGLKIRLPLRTASANLSANALIALDTDAATP